LRDLRVGTRIGRYRLTARIGHGGMGVVFQARAIDAPTDVALKLLPDVHKGDPAAARRLLREARATGAIDHPRVVRMLEVGEEAGDVFIAMELIRGASLQELLQERGPMHWRDATRAMVQALQGLQAAHTCGVVHRDLKPANLLLSPEGVKVADLSSTHERLVGYPRP